MSVESTTVTRGPATRADRVAPLSGPTPAGPFCWTWPRRFGALMVLASGFVLVGGGSLDPGEVESRLGLASFERIGPFGQVFGSWDPSVLPGQLLPSLVWAWGEGGIPTSASVRWPAAIAAVVIGLILARRAATTLGGRAGVLVGLCTYGSVAMVDRSSGLGLDLVTALGTVGVLDRLLGKGSDRVAGAWAALAFLAGGWPPLAVVALVTVVLGRPGSALSAGLVVPPLVTAAAWSAWACSVAPVEAWAAALTLPLTKGPAWWLAPGALALALPWSPLAALVGSRSVREGWDPAGRALVVGWMQVTGACLLAGTVVPGLATAALVPALAGLAVAAAAVCDRMLAGGGAAASGVARRVFLGWPVALGLLWAILVVAAGGYLAAAVPYYRFVSVILILAAVPAAALAVRSASRGESAGAFLAVAVVAVSIKVGHFGYYVPEWNYRISQGPWGRAVGQWVPPRWPIYTVHAWNPELAFATRHAVRQLPSPQHLAYQPGAARYVLLLESEFDNWPAAAPGLSKISSFQDEYGSVRVLARTAGPLPWTPPDLNR